MRKFLSIVALGLLLLLVGCEREPETVRISGFTMGTYFNVVVVPEARIDKEEMERQLNQLLRALNQIASSYIEESEVNQFNRAEPGQWIEVSPPLWEILMTSQQVSWLTGGAFDVTVAPLVNLWGFGPDDRRGEIPDEADIEQARQRVGFGNLQLDLQEPRVRKQKDVKVDLGGVAKGYGADAIAEWLEQQGFTNYMVEIGGDLRLRGESPRGDLWRIGIEVPDGLPERVQRAIQLSDVGLVTSGDYRNYFEVEGERYAHTIDPRTGWPAQNDLVSVTVIAATAAEADALATAFMVMGADRALQLAERNDIPLYLMEKVDDELRIAASPAFAPFLDKEPE